MTHMVIFRSPEGRPGYHQAESVDEAVRFVERLTNEDSVTDARIFYMQEVPIEFKTYYRVEVAEGTQQSPPAFSGAPPVEAAGVPWAGGPGVGQERSEEPVGAFEASTTEPADAEASGNSGSRFGLFSRS